MLSSYIIVHLKQGFPPVPSFRKTYGTPVGVPGQAEGYRDEFSPAPGACGQQRSVEHPTLFQPAKILSQACAFHIVT